METLNLWETISNELNDIQKSLRESIRIQQKPLKIQQEKRQQSFQLITDKDKSIDRKITLVRLSTFMNMTYDAKE